MTFWILCNRDAEDRLVDRALGAFRLDQVQRNKSPQAVGANRETQTSERVGDERNQ